MLTVVEGMLSCQDPFRNFVSLLLRADPLPNDIEEALADPCLADLKLSPNVVTLRWRGRVDTHIMHRNYAAAAMEFAVGEASPKLFTDVCAELPTEKRPDIAEVATFVAEDTFLRLFEKVKVADLKKCSGAAELLHDLGVAFREADDMVVDGVLVTALLPELDDMGILLKPSVETLKQVMQVLAWMHLLQRDALGRSAFLCSRPGSCVGTYAYVGSLCFLTNWSHLIQESNQNVKHACIVIIAWS